MKKPHSFDYIVIYKPFRVLSQFSPEGDKDTLASIGDFPKDVYPVGRLDYDSEGLLILTNDKRLNKKLLDPENQHPRTYLVQVEGAPTNQDVEILRSGILIKVKGKNHLTLPAKVDIPETLPNLPDRNPPIRFRKNVPDTWIRLTLTEGKNRQVRKMTAGAGFPTLRLVRWAIGNVTVEGMQPGDVKRFVGADFYNLLFNER